MQQPSLFLDATVNRTHRVFHNSGIMQYMAPFLITDIPSRNAFKLVCRIWRQVYYTRVLDKRISIKGRESFYKFCGMNLCPNAYGLLSISDECPKFKCAYFYKLMHHHPIPTVINWMKDIVQVRGNTYLKHSLSLFLQYIELSEDAAMQRYTANYDTYRDNVHARDYCKFFVDCLISSESPPIRLLSAFASHLTVEDKIALLDTMIISTTINRAYNCLSFVDPTIDQFKLYIQKTSGLTRLGDTTDIRFSGGLRRFCEKMASILTVQDYLSCVNLPHQAAYRDIILDAGRTMAGFEKTLFSSWNGNQHADAYQTIERYIMLGHLNPASTDMYLFGKQSMTLFQFAAYISSEKLLEFISKDPRFKMHEHMPIINLLIEKRNLNFLGSLIEQHINDYDDIMYVLRLFTEAKLKPGRKNSREFDRISGILTDKLYHVGPRKRIKLIMPK